MKRIASRRNGLDIEAGRAARNYETGELAKARALVPRRYIEVIRALVIGKSDSIVLAYLRAIPVALSSNQPADFAALYDQMLADYRLTESEINLLVAATLDMMERELGML